MRPAALGFSHHSGWTAAVVVGGSARAPEIVLRERLPLHDGATTEAAQVYHAAIALPLARAELLVRSTSARARELAAGGTARLVAAARERGFLVRCAGVAAPKGRLPSDLARILAAHPFVHLAEGRLYRDCLVQGCTDAALQVVEASEAEAAAALARALAVAPQALAVRLAELGQRAGRPWARDQKTAAVFGWLALAGPAGGCAAAGRG